MKLTNGWIGKETTLERLKEQVNSGWSDIVERLVIDLEKLGWDGIINQVKEKFGGLCFYIGGESNTAIGNRIRQAEKESYKTCEMCGRPGKLRDDLAWWHTMCDHCYGKALEKYRQLSKEMS